MPLGRPTATAVLNCEPRCSPLCTSPKMLPTHRGPVSGSNFFALAKTRRLDSRLGAVKYITALRQLHKQSEHSLCALGTIINIKQITFFARAAIPSPSGVIYFGALKTAFAIWPRCKHTLARIGDQARKREVRRRLALHKFSLFL